MMEVAVSRQKLVRLSAESELETDERRSPSPPPLVRRVGRRWCRLCLRGPRDIVDRRVRARRRCGGDDCSRIEAAGACRHLRAGLGTWLAAAIRGIPEPSRARDRLHSDRDEPDMFRGVEPMDVAPRRRRLPRPWVHPVLAEGPGMTDFSIRSLHSLRPRLPQRAVSELAAPPTWG